MPPDLGRGPGKGASHDWLAASDGEGAEAPARKLAQSKQKTGTNPSDGRDHFLKKSHAEFKKGNITTGRGIRPRPAQHTITITIP